MSAGPGGLIVTPRDAAGERSAGETGAGQQSCIRPVPLQDCPSFAGFLHILMCGPYTASSHEGKTVFAVSGACTACGACVAACPAKNIVITEDRPARSDRCGLCRACASACPVQAIRINEMLPGTGSGSNTREEDHP